MNSTKLFQDTPPNVQPNTSVSGLDGSNLFPNDPILAKSQQKPFLPPATKLPNRPLTAAAAAGRKCPKHLHVKVRLRFNRNKLCPVNVSAK